MRLEHRFTCPLRQGFHARPASLLADAVANFAATATLRRAGAETGADVRSVLSIIALDLTEGEPCVLVCEGEDAPAALEAALACIHALPELDDAPAAVIAAAGRLPRTLRGAHVQAAVGLPAAPGIGVGVLVRAGASLPDLASLPRSRGDKHELDQFAAALDAADVELQKRARGAQGFERDLLAAHRRMLRDASFAERVHRAIHDDQSAAKAVTGAVMEVAQALRASSSAYTRERAGDVVDLGRQVLLHLGVNVGSEPRLSQPSVVAADALTPGEFLALDRQHLAGLVLGSTGPTSHTVLLARSFGVPAVSGALHATTHWADGTQVLIDGDGGFAATAEAVAVQMHFDRRTRAARARAGRLDHFKGTLCTTAEGERIEVAANVSTADEVPGAVKAGAEGVGLFRTEMLFLDRPATPSEEEQVSAYTRAVRDAAGQPVILRTFDIGGDKPAPYLRVGQEENPFLGVRGLRLYRVFPDVLHTQLRAALRAATAGPLKIMAPMVTTPADMAWFRAEVERAKSSLAAEGLPHGDPPIGAMLEVPSLALHLEALFEHADFISIGTNDLAQYWFAADRGNAATASLSSPFDPSFLRLLELVVSTARRLGRWVGVCGDFAREPLGWPLLVGMGVHELSMPAAVATEAKAAIAGMTRGGAEATLAAALGCKDAASARGRVSQRRTMASCLLEAALIDTSCNATSKAEVIADLVTLVHGAGRTDTPLDLEEAVWSREETYSTGLGHGFAIPHCKSDAVAVPTLAVARLREPIEWGSLDGEPVRVVFLLAAPAADGGAAHLKTFAKLARRLVHEEFRAKVLGAADAAAVEGVLRAELDIQGSSTPSSAG